MKKSLRYITTKKKRSRLTTILMKGCWNVWGRGDYLNIPTSFWYTIYWGGGDCTHQIYLSLPRFLTFQWPSNVSASNKNVSNVKTSFHKACSTYKELIKFHSIYPRVLFSFTCVSINHGIRLWEWAYSFIVNKAQRAHTQWGQILFESQICF